MRVSLVFALMLSILVLFVYSYTLGYISYFAFGLISAVIFAPSKLSLFIKENPTFSKIWLIAMFAFHVVLWPNYLLVTIINSFKEGS